VGLATTQAFLSHQWDVLGVDVNDMDYSKIDERDQERFHFHRGDLTKEGECDEVVRICVAKYGEKIDVLANIAGIIDSFEAADTVSDKTFDRVIAVNLTAPTRMIRAVLPIMKAKQHGCIINCGSKAGMSGASAGVAYTASKHGLVGLTKHTAWRFRQEGIRCNAVLPGTIDTNIGDTMVKETFDMESFQHITPVLNIHNPVDQKPTMAALDVANVILFLVSDQARSINGALLPIDAGWSVI